MDTNLKPESISLGLAVASLLVSIAAVWIARSSLSQAKQVADRDRRDWKQRKWFDLYLKANEAYDALDRLQALYAEGVAKDTEEFGRYWNNMIFLFRELHAMAGVFPKNSAIDELFLRTVPFKNREEALSRDCLDKMLKAMEGIRQKALVDPSVLD